MKSSDRITARRTSAPATILPAKPNRDRAHPGRSHLACDRLNPSGLDHQALHDSVEQEHELACRARVRDDRLGRQLADLGDCAPALELLVRELIEQVDLAKLRERRTFRLLHELARYSCIRDTAIDPSPTALATRLIERARTSPATNTPGTLVSST